MKKNILLVVLVILSAFGVSTAMAQDAVINVASYNLRQKNDRDIEAGNGWERRYPYIAQIIRFHDFDIVGTQEGFKFMLDSLLSQLPGYAYIGVGREDGAEAGEHCAIFYRTDLFEVLEHGDFWLSETPDVAGSKGWDAVLPRVCTWGHFRHLQSGKEFLFFNLHMDHIGKQARVESARLVQKKMVEINANLPAILTGDFNVDQTHQSYAALTRDGILNDSYEVAEFRYAPVGTVNSFHPSYYSKSRIDHIMLTRDVRVLKYGVFTDTYRTLPDRAVDSVKGRDFPEEISFSDYEIRVPSDHYPIRSTIVLP
jgi:endonuclease/exonuclease/phosphatase family metal-dependent hydrolase